MAVTYKLTDGTTTVDLIASSGFLISAGGMQAPSIPESALHGGATVVERFTLRVKGTSHDNVASQEQTLIKLLRKARDFHEGVWVTKPVYLQAQTAGETSARYAMVYGTPEIEGPSGLDVSFKLSNVLQNIGLAIEREHPWSSGAPNTLPTATTLGESDGPATPTMVHLANFRDDGNITHVFSDDGGVFSGNLISAATGTALWPAVPAVNDALYFISTDIAFKHVCLALAQAGDQSWTLVLEYYNGANYNTVLTLGTNFTLFGGDGAEIASLAAWLNGNITGDQALRSLNLFPPSDWATVAVNAVTGYPLRLRVSAFTSGSTIPQKNGNTIYSQRKNYVELPAASLVGDSPQTTLLRLFSPSGGGTTVGKANLSRMLVGARSNPASTFEPVLNLGNSDNPAAWSTAYGTDTAAAADNAAPGRAHAAVSFATEATSVPRVTLTGDDILSSYAPGEYEVLVRCQQIGGSPGDCKVGVEVFLAGSANDDPHVFLGEAVPTLGADDGPEVLLMGTADEPVILQLPFSRFYNADSLASVDLILKVYVERITGAATMRLYDLWLMPIDEGSVGVDDPVTDTTYGSSALRGGTVFDLDGGVLANRSLKYHVQGTALIPVEEWGRYNRLPELKNIGVKTRLYFLLLHYSTTWDGEPLVASLGNHLACKVYAHSRYALLRGAG